MIEYKITKIKTTTMKIHFCTLALLTLITFSSCKKESNQEPHEIDKADWLIGNWENKSAFGNLSENWEKLNDSTFTGTSYFIKGNDTLHSESVVLIQIGNNLIYSPNVKGQNNDLPVPFKLTSGTATQLIFENPKHDFPQKITYKKITADSIVAEISGMQQGKPAYEAYAMTRK
jgi:hypothetical protein